MDPTEFSKILSTMLERGMRPPFMFTVMAINGAVIVGRFFEADGGGTGCEFVCEHQPDAGNMRLPINMLFVDAVGNAARVVLEPSGEVQYLN